jgi:thiol-disulfide isomerase/thioredoxin
MLASLVLGAGTPAMAGPSVAAPAKALCLVCAIKHGEAAAEPVKAARRHAGQDYGFCSEKCAQEFDADPTAYVPASFPRPVPEFEVRDLSGRIHTPGALKGRVVLIDFWATWCAPCRKSMPELQALHQKYSGMGLTVLGISIDEGGAKPVKKFVSSKRISYPIALDSGASPAWAAFRVKAVPAAFLLDREGRIVAQWTGVPADAEALERRVRELLAVN